MIINPKVAEYRSKIGVNSQVTGKPTQFTDQYFTYTLSSLSNKSSSIKMEGQSLDRPRNIGVLYFNNDKLFLYLQRDPELHLMRKLKAYGINETIFSCFKPDAILIEDTRHSKIYQIDYDDADKCRDFLNFKTRGFECQRFIPLTKLKEVIIDESNSLLL